jgi:hypothetical protein
LEVFVQRVLFVFLTVVLCGAVFPQNEGPFSGGRWQKELKECAKKLAKYRKQREIMGNRNSYSRIYRDVTFMRMIVMF